MRASLCLLVLSLFAGCRTPGVPAADTSHMRRFVLERHRDISGISGTGIVADGVLDLDTQQCVVVFRGATPTITIHSYPTGLESVGRVNLHGGATEIRWVDP